MHPFRLHSRFSYQPNVLQLMAKAKNEACLTFVSQAAMDENVKEKYGLEKTVVPVKGCRNISEKRYGI